MSQCSTASSQVSFRGENGIDLEQALDQNIRELQRFLNSLQCSLRQINMGYEQDLEYADALKEADNCEECIDDMQYLFQELRDICYQLVGEPSTPEEKAYLKDIEKLIGKKIPMIDNHPFPLIDHNPEKAPKQQQGRPNHNRPKPISNVGGKKKYYGRR